MRSSTGRAEGGAGLEALARSSGRFSPSPTRICRFGPVSPCALDRPRFRRRRRCAAARRSVARATGQQGRADRRRPLPSLVCNPILTPSASGTVSLGTKVRPTVPFPHHLTHFLQRTKNLGGRRRRQEGPSRPAPRAPSRARAAPALALGRREGVLVFDRPSQPYYLLDSACMKGGPSQRPDRPNAPGPGAIGCRWRSVGGRSF